MKMATEMVEIKCDECGLPMRLSAAIAALEGEKVCGRCIAAAIMEAAKEARGAKRRLGPGWYETGDAGHWRKKEED